MSQKYPIVEVTTDMRSSTEQLGSKPKFWFHHNDEDWLFKEARVNTGEDWAEKVASEIASLLDIPTHHTELAIWENKRGCAVKSFLAPDNILVHGNELLGDLLTGYDRSKQWGQADHTFDNIVKVLEKLFPADKARREAAYQMTGYLVFDALVGNTDRHHQNWGVLGKVRVLPDQKLVFSLQLAPTFDHASSLGRELRDEARERHLENNTLRRYLENGKGGIFGDVQSKFGLSPLAAARLLAKRYPEFFKPWQARVAEISDYALVEIMSRIPDERISPTGRDFALALLFESRKLIADIS